jgi:hypothetical protein
VCIAERGDEREGTRRPPAGTGGGPREHHDSLGPFCTRADARGPTAGGALCWGNGYHGQLGDGTNSASLVPVRVLDFAPESLPALGLLGLGVVVAAILTASRGPPTALG